MATKAWKLAKVHVMEEAAFQTDPDGSGAGYLPLKTIDALFQPKIQVIDRPGQTGDMTRNPSVPGVKEGTFTFKLEAKGSGTPAGNAVVAIASESSPLVKNIMGTVVRGTGDLVQAGSTASVINVVSGANYTKFMAVCILGEVRVITGIAANALTLDRALGLGVPANGTPVYASSLFKRANTGQKSMAFVGTRDGIEYTFLGCIGSFKFAGMTAKGTPLMEFTYKVSDWSVTTKGGTLPSSDIAGITAVKAPVVKGSPFVVNAVEDFAMGCELDPGQSYVYQETTTGTQARSGFQLVDAKPMGSYKPWYVASHLTDLVSQVEYSFMFSCGDQTNGFAWYAKKGQFTDVTLEDRQGIVGENIPFAINDNGTDPELVICQF